MHTIMYILEVVLNMFDVIFCNFYLTLHMLEVLLCILKAFWISLNLPLPSELIFAILYILEVVLIIFGRNDLGAKMGQNTFLFFRGVFFAKIQNGPPAHPPTPTPSPHTPEKRTSGF